jgi:uncharacterized protein (TIGR02246 family)
MITLQNNTVDPQITAQLDARGKKFDEAYDNNNAAAVAALFTEDGVFVTPKGAIYGREAIERYYLGRFQEWHFSNHLGKADANSPHMIGPAGDEVWSTGEWSQTIRSGNGEVIQLKGYWSTIDVREDDAWKARMMTYNITPAEEN